MPWLLSAMKDVRQTKYKLKKVTVLARTEKESKKGRTGDALALISDEGRDKLR